MRSLKTGGAEGERHGSPQPLTNPGFFTLANTECVAAVCNRVNAADLTFAVKRAVDQSVIVMARS
jgi:hypothetical protein